MWTLTASFFFSTFFSPVYFGLVEPKGLLKGLLEGFITLPLLSKKLFISDIFLLIALDFLLL